MTESSRGRTSLETAKLKGEVADTEVSIQRRFNALGKKVFEMLSRGALNEEVLMRDSREISSLFKRITELEEAVELEAKKMQSEVDAGIGSSPDKSDAENDSTFLKKEIEAVKIDEQKFNSDAQPAVKKVASPEDEFMRKTSKKWIWRGIFIVIFLIAVTGSYLYFSTQAGERSSDITIGAEHKVEKPVSSLLYKPEPPKAVAAISADPDKIEREINSALREEGLMGIRAAVSDNLEVTLKGSVRSNSKKERAFEIAEPFTSKGIKRIRDMIFVVKQYKD